MDNCHKKRKIKDNDLFNDGKKIAISISEGEVQDLGTDENTICTAKICEQNSEDSPNESQSQQTNKDINDAANRETPETLAVLKSDDGRFHCPLCVTTYSRSHKLKLHLQIKHKIDKGNTLSKNNLNQKCSFAGCNQVFYKKIQLIAHMKQEHSQTYDEKELTFKNIDAFAAWKAKEELQNYVFFTKHFGESKNRSYYYCQQDGKIYSHRKNDEPFRKTNRRARRGSVKTGCICPAKMVVVKSVDDESIKVIYTSTHSHPVSVENTIHHPIPDSMKSDIIAKISLGCSVDEIYKEFSTINTHAEGDKNSAKGHHITKANIRDLKYKLSKYMKLNPGDKSSIVVLIQEMLRNEVANYDKAEEIRFQENIEKLIKVFEEPVIKRLCLSDVNRSIEKLIQESESVKQRDINEMTPEELAEFFEKLKDKSVQ